MDTQMKEDGKLNGDSKDVRYGFSLWVLDWFENLKP